jgi:hypothetical protein
MSTISSFDDALDFYPASKGDHAAGSLTAKLRALWVAMSEGPCSRLSLPPVGRTRPVGGRSRFAGVRRVPRALTAERATKKGGSLAAPPRVSTPGKVRQPARSGRHPASL